MRVWSWCGSPGRRMPGTTRLSRGASSRAVCRSSAARISPPQPPSSARRTRFGTMCGGAESSLVSTVTANAVGVGRPAWCAPSTRPSTPAQHVDTTGRVQGQVLDAERSEHATRAVDLRRDVEQLEIQEHLVAQVTQGPDGIGSGGREKLETDLGNAEPWAHRRAQAHCFHQVVDIEDERQPTTHVVGDLPVHEGLDTGLRHVLLRSARARI